MCFALFLLCDVILRALLCLVGEGVRRYWELRQREKGTGKYRDGEEGVGERVRERDKQRETENYIAVCKNQFKTCEAKRNGCMS